MDSVISIKNVNAKYLSKLQK